MFLTEMFQGGLENVLEIILKVIDIPLIYILASYT